MLLATSRHQRLRLRSPTKPHTKNQHHTSLTRRPSLSLASSPHLLLLHLAGITLTTSCLIPLIGARYASSRATTPPTQATSEELHLLDDSASSSSSSTNQPPRPAPLPSPAQLRALASRIRISLSPAAKNHFDAAFTLRQLRLMETPQLFVSPEPTGVKLVQPEPWVWRYPTAVAIHHIVKLAVISQSKGKDSNRKETVKLSGEKDEAIQTQLVTIAVKLAVNALYWDSIVLREVLRNRGSEGGEEWKGLFTRRLINGGKADEEIVVDARLGGKESVHRSNRSEKNIELEQMEQVASKITSSYQASLAPTVQSPPHSPRSPPSPPSPSAPHSPLHLLSSLPPRTLELLFLYLVEHTPFADSQGTALLLSSAMSKLHIRRPLSLIQYSFDHALDQVLDGDEPRRLDHASLLLFEWVNEVERTGKGSTGLRNAFKRLRACLMSRSLRNEFSTRPRKVVLATVANLARLLEKEWERSKGGASSGKQQYSLVPSLIALLIKFPKPIDESLLKASFKARGSEGPTRRVLARTHHEVYGMVKRLLGRILEDIIQTPIFFGVSHVVVGEPLDPAPPVQQYPTLQIEDYNNLIYYSLRELSSIEIATSLVTSLQSQSLVPTAATCNILLPYVSKTASDALEYVQSHPANERTLPSFFSLVKQVSDFTDLDKLVFAVLPELDSRRPPDPDADLPDPATPRSVFGYPNQSPPLPGRSPYLYITILDALAKAGKTGLAERVFRSARWAAELSRKDFAEGKSTTKGWVLPEHAFTIMLHLYSSEADRGRRAERRLSAPPPDSASESASSGLPLPSSPYVRGWGRHALRVFIRQERANRLRTALGPTTETRTPREFRGVAPQLFLRSKAAPIVAQWELAGGSKEQPELENLEIAITSVWNREACEKLFPGKVWEANGLRGEWEEKREYRLRRRERRRALKRMMDASV